MRPKAIKWRCGNKVAIKWRCGEKGRASAPRESEQACFVSMPSKITVTTKPIHNSLRCIRASIVGFITMSYTTHAFCATMQSPAFLLNTYYCSIHDLILINNRSWLGPRCSSSLVISTVWIGVRNSINADI